jgi:hypothetical protein
MQNNRLSPPSCAARTQAEATDENSNVPLGCDTVREYLILRAFQTYLSALPNIRYPVERVAMIA